MLHEADDMRRGRLAKATPDDGKEYRGEESAADTTNQGHNAFLLLHINREDDDEAEPEEERHDRFTEVEEGDEDGEIFPSLRERALDGTDDDDDNKQ